MTLDDDRGYALRRAVDWLASRPLCEVMSLAHLGCLIIAVYYALNIMVPRHLAMIAEEGKRAQHEFGEQLKAILDSTEKQVALLQESHSRDRDAWRESMNQRNWQRAAGVGPLPFDGNK
jgi:hypothetical protein